MTPSVGAPHVVQRDEECFSSTSHIGFSGAVKNHFIPSLIAANNFIFYPGLALIVYKANIKHNVYKF